MMQGVECMTLANMPGILGGAATVRLVNPGVIQVQYPDFLILHAGADDKTEDANAELCERLRNAS